MYQIKQVIQNNGMNYMVKIYQLLTTLKIIKQKIHLKQGVNYNSDLGEINSGNDYEKNERNIYDLYIPYSTEFTKDKHNGIIFFIHGGSWT